MPPARSVVLCYMYIEHWVGVMGPLYIHIQLYSYRKSFGTPIFCHPSLVWDLRLFNFQNYRQLPWRLVNRLLFLNLISCKPLTLILNGRCTATLLNQANKTAWQTGLSHNLTHSVFHWAWDIFLNSKIMFIKEKQSPPLQNIKMSPAEKSTQGAKQRKYTCHILTASLQKVPSNQSTSTMYACNT